MMHQPISAKAILRNYDVRLRSDARDQPDNARLMADRVAHIGTEEAERIDRVVAEVRMREINPGADNADPNTFP